MNLYTTFFFLLILYFCLTNDELPDWQKDDDDDDEFGEFLIYFLIDDVISRLKIYVFCIHLSCCFFLFNTCLRLFLFFRSSSFRCSTFLFFCPTRPFSLSRPMSFPRTLSLPLLRPRQVRPAPKPRLLSSFYIF